MRTTSTSIEAPDMPVAVLDALPAHVCVLDAQGIVLWVNRAWRQFAIDNGGNPDLTCEGSNYLAACRPAEPGPGDTTASLAEQDSLCGFTAALRDVLDGRLPRAEVEYPCHSPTEQRWFVVEATAIDGPRGARAVVIHHPITLRRLADLRQQEELRLLALGTLASGIAHDFNNLLSVILGRTRMALEDLGPAHPAAAHVHPARAAAERASALVAKILAFGRGEPGPAHVQDLVPIVRDTVDLLRAGLPSGVQLSTDWPAGPLWARVDASEVAQLVLNLCRNAADALERVQGRIHVRLADPSEGSAGTAELVVIDDGIGIPDDVRQRIFEPFFSTKPRGHGTGLGLAIVHGIVGRLGGAIEVHSLPGQGSTFRVRLPLSASAPAPRPRQAPDAPDPSPLPLTDAGLRVLLVDDDEVVGLSIEAFLARAQVHTDRVQGGAEALRRVQAGESFDLVLTDQAMPGMTGLELADALRRLQPALAVMMMSGFVDDRLLARARELGLRGVLRKERLYDELMPALASLVRPPEG